MSISHDNIFSLKETNRLYRELMKNGGIPKSKKHLIIFNILNLHISKKNKEIPIIKKGSNVMVLFELNKKECINLKFVYNKNKTKNNLVKHYISGKIVKIINKQQYRIYFPIDKSTLNICKGAIKLIK